MKFKVGDRVSVYDRDEKYTGTVSRINEDGTIYIQQKLCVIYAHAKQCRKLVKKERRRVYISQSFFDGYAVNYTGERPSAKTVPVIGVLAGKETLTLSSGGCPSGYIEFVETRKKK